VTTLTTVFASGPAEYSVSEIIVMKFREINFNFEIISYFTILKKYIYNFVSTLPVAKFS
jgi:hypothetical protein